MRRFTVEVVLHATHTYRESAVKKRKKREEDSHLDEGHLFKAVGCLVTQLDFADYTSHLFHLFYIDERADVVWVGVVNKCQIGEEHAWHGKDGGAREEREWVSEGKRDQGRVLRALGRTAMYQGRE